MKRLIFGPLVFLAMALAVAFPVTASTTITDHGLAIFAPADSLDAILAAPAIEVASLMVCTAYDDPPNPAPDPAPEPPVGDPPPQPEPFGFCSMPLHLVPK